MKLQEITPLVLWFTNMEPKSSDLQQDINLFSILHPSFWWEFPCWVPGCERRVFTTWISIGATLMPDMSALPRCPVKNSPLGPPHWDHHERFCMDHFGPESREMGDTWQGNYSNISIISLAYLRLVNCSQWELFATGFGLKSFGVVCLEIWAILRKCSSDAWFLILKLYCGV